MNEHTKGLVDNNLHDGNVYCGGLVVANCYSSFLSPATIKANAERFARTWNEYDKLVEQNKALVDAIKRIKTVYDNETDLAGVIAKETLAKILKT